MCDALCVALCQFRSLILPIKYLFINITVFRLCHVAKYSVHGAKYSVVKCLINVAQSAGFDHRTSGRGTALVAQNKETDATSASALFLPRLGSRSG